MKLLISLLLLSSVSFAQATVVVEPSVSAVKASPPTVVACPVTQIKENKSNTRQLIWTNVQGEGKILLIKNLDTNKYYPQSDIPAKNIGFLEKANFPKNKNGYEIVLALVDDSTQLSIKNHLATCFKKKDCSMDPTKIYTKKVSCSILKSNVVQP